MAFLQDILKKASGMVAFSKATNSVVGIDIGTSAIKAVQLKRNGAQIALETYGELNLGSYQESGVAGQVVTLPPETIAKAVGDLLREANITTRASYLSIQSQATLVFVLSLPQVSSSELASLIPNEARKYIPVPLTEVSLDWYVIPEKVTYAQEENSTDTRKKMEVVVVAVRNETLSQYKQISDNAKLEMRGEEIEIFSAIRSSFHREIAPTIVIDFGANTTKLAVVEYGVVRTHHVINRGAAFITDSLARTMSITFEKAEELKRTVGMHTVPGQEAVAESIKASIQYVLNEARTALMEYERTAKRAATKVILVGGGASLAGLQEAVAEQFGLEVVMSDPFSKAEAPEFMKPVLAKAGPEFATACGLALKEFL